MIYPATKPRPALKLLDSNLIQIRSSDVVKWNGLFVPHFGLSMVIESSYDCPPVKKYSNAGLKIYHKIPIISPELIIVQKALLQGLISGELILGGAVIRRTFVSQNGFGLSVKTLKDNSLKELKTAISNSQLGLYSEGLMNGGIFASDIWEAYFWEGLVFGGIFAVCYLLCIE